MANIKELDGLDQFVAKAMGLACDETDRRCHVFDGDKWRLFQPTRNAADRDEVVDWLWKEKHLTVKITYWSGGNIDSGYHNICFVNVFGNGEVIVNGADYTTTGEAVCRAVEDLQKQGALK